MAAKSWREVANILAERLSHARCEQHSERNAVPDRCPFCADRAAYRVWEAKSGETHRIVDNGPTIDVLREYINRQAEGT